MYLSKTFKSILSGIAAGVINGLFGAGGGMILVPILICWIHMDDQDAFATSVAVIFPICFISFLVYCRSSFVDIPSAIPYLWGGLIGGFAGGKIFHRISPAFLHKLFGVLILWGGIRSLWS